MTTSTDVPMVHEVNCTTGEETIRPMTQTEIDQRAADQVTHQAMLDAQVAEQTRINGLKASIAIKRQSDVWIKFSPEETAYLTSVNQ